MSQNDLLKIIDEYPLGVAAGALANRLNISRPTLNRWLKAGCDAGLFRQSGRGPAVRYFSTDPLAAITTYFLKSHTERPIARYREETLDYVPIQLVAFPNSLPPASLSRREMAKFLIDFACASSVLEGGSYSMLDTQALFNYGERNPNKPAEDAILVLNHRVAFEYLYDHPSLDSIFQVHALLTNDHEQEALAESDHFLTAQFRGVTREYMPVDIAFSTYSPVFRPGTGYVAKMLETVLARSADINDPIQAAFYLMTRLPYLQPFQNGNKRTARAICNVPLLQAGLPPISFVDFTKRDYILSLLAIYELNDFRLAEKGFLDAYAKSCNRLKRPMI
ncbi:MAG: Fic family protein [Rhodocyclaceae bacterium]|nr:Fic family protein [Rhodocyclaceae bacterium]